MRSERSVYYFRGCDTPVLFVNIYAPNKIYEQEAFFKKIERKLENYDFDPNRKIIIGGDFIIFFDEDLDCLGGHPKVKGTMSPEFC